MGFGITISALNGKRAPIERPDRGKSIIAFPDSYVVVDLETTGLDSFYDDIIEVCAVRVVNGNVDDTFSSLVNPHTHINGFIEALTGITDEMVQSAPFIEDVLPRFLSFLGDQIIVGHHVSFDVNFLYDACTYYLNRPVCNNFIDTMRIFRKLHPELEHHRLLDMVMQYEISDMPAHRAQADCLATFSCFKILQQEVLLEYGSFDQFSGLFVKKHKNRSNNNSKIDLRTLTTENTIFDESNPFYKKRCVFTGKLDRLNRKDAAQLVVDMGGLAENNVTKHTNFLILGDLEYSANVKDNKSNKLRTAEAYILKGQDLTILSEKVFFEMINEQTDSPVSEGSTQIESLTEEQIYNAITSQLSHGINADFLRFVKLKQCASVYYNSSLVCRIHIKKTDFYLDISVKHKDLFNSFLITQIKSQPDIVRVHFSSVADIGQTKNSFIAIIKSIPVPSTFDVCHRYEECSDALKCIHPDQKHALECSYRKKLEKGIVFFGKNRNIDSEQK